MKHIHTFKSFLSEAYTPVAYNKKVTGVYEVTCGSKKTEVKVAGFEREGDDTDSLYLMDSDPMKPEWGGLIVKNSDTHKLEKGGIIQATISKTKEACKIRQIK